MENIEQLWRLDGANADDDRDEDVVEEIDLDAEDWLGSIEDGGIGFRSGRASPPPPPPSAFVRSE